MIAALEDARLVVCVGPGGVGKTTLAAALAVDAAARGRRVALLTIDPARRLADALGGGALDDRLRPVPIEGAAGTLDAAMLETKASYDALIARIAGDPVARARILENRVYQAFSRTLARSHAYVAMERLHDVLAEGAHDLVVLDTPPTRSALDILDAPGRLLSFLDERVLGAFVRSSEPRGAAAWIRARGSAVLLRLFGLLAGDTVAGELAGFFEVFFHLRRGFAERAARVQRELLSASTAFILVSAPEATHLDDAAYLRDGLLARRVPLRAYLFNRAFLPGEDGAPLGPGAAYDAEAILDRAWPEAGPARADALAAIATAQALRRELALENEALDRAMRAFCHDAGATLRLRFPTLAEEPTSIPALRALLARGTPI